MKPIFGSGKGWTQGHISKCAEVRDAYVVASFYRRSLDSWRLGSEVTGAER